MVPYAGLGVPSFLTEKSTIMSQSTKPNEPAATAKTPEKPKRVPYPGLNPDKDGKTTTKLKEIPADFDPKTHKPLSRKDFENEAPFLRKLADELQARAEKLRAEANDAEKLGSASQRATAKKLRAMFDKFSELRKELEGSGVDVSAIIGNLQQTQAAPEAPKG